MVPCRRPRSLWFIRGYMLAKHFGQCHVSSLPVIRCRSRHYLIGIFLIVVTAGTKIGLRGCRRRSNNFAAGQGHGCDVWNAS
jgi:hypothetical protein